MKWVDSFDWLGMERRQTEERSAERVAVPPYIYIYILIYYFNKKTKKGERETWGLVCLDEFDDLSIYDYWRKQTIMASRHLMCLLPIPSNTHTHIRFWRREIGDVMLLARPAVSVTINFFLWGMILGA